MSEQGAGPDRPPVRAVHVGLGAFHRAHQAWYTQLANDLTPGEKYGIWAFTGRRPDQAVAMTKQDCRYSVIERGAAADRAIPIAAIVAATDGADRTVWRQALANPDVAVVTLTITEAGYRPDPGDAERLRAGEQPRSVPGRIVDGLAARREAGAGPLAVLSCDNLPGNGEVTRSVVTALAAEVDAGLAEWIGSEISFVSSMVDRITPATTEPDLQLVEQLTGARDECAVITEPFSEWIISGEFPAGRPAWELAGAEFVDRIEPYEQRKLWLLNGGHSLLAYLGLFRGHSSVDEAVADPVCAAALEALWDEAAVVLPFDEVQVAAARAALLERFGNPKIRHRLTQIASDGSLKLPLRVIDVCRARLDRGMGVGTGGATAIAAWIEHLTGDDVNDPGAGELVPALTTADSDAARARTVLGVIAPDLMGDDDLIAAVVHAAAELRTAG